MERYIISQRFLIVVTKDFFQYNDHNLLPMVINSMVSVMFIQHLNVKPRHLWRGCKGAVFSLRKPCPLGRGAGFIGRRRESSSRSYGSLVELYYFYYL